jgi:hypothetical protein
VTFPSATFPSDIEGTLPVVYEQNRPYVMADFATGFNLPASPHQASQWSPGCTLITPIPFQRPPNQAWQVTALAVTIGLALVQWQDIADPGPSLDPPFPSFGKLGKIIAGLVTRSSQNTVSGTTNSVQPYQQPPSDATLLDTLFDPAENALPPSNFLIANSLPAHGTLLAAQPYAVANAISQPLDISTQDPVGFLLTMLPSLTQNAELWITSVQYTVKLSNQYSY